jgi:hypothetical protein
MGHCKVRICHLTLAPGVLTQRSGEAEEEDQDLEVERILAHEHLQQVMQLKCSCNRCRNGRILSEYEMSSHIA